jgi:PKHD-type hydroxylase
MNRYIFPNDKKTNQTTYYWFKKGFSDEEIQKIKTYLEDIEFQESSIFSGTDKSVRNSRIKWINCNADTEWLYEKIYGYAKEANDAIYNFKLYYSKDSIQYSKYSKNGKYDWHIDIGENENNLRKLSCSVLLNDPGDFEGGNFEYWIKSTPEKVPLEKGSVLFFPSFFLHRVSEIYKGERESLVLWIGGDSYQ